MRDILPVFGLVFFQILLVVLNYTIGLDRRGIMAWEECG